MILHCMKKSEWDRVKSNMLWGAEDIFKYGFIHCSTKDSFDLVAPNFKEEKEPLVLVLIDETLLHADVKYEDFDNCGTKFPHIYGLVNNSSVIEVLPFLKDTNGDYVRNEELKKY